MRKWLASLALMLTLVLGFSGIGFAQILDTVVFGDSASEGAHGITQNYTNVITGGLGQPARKIFLDPADTTSYESGYVQVTMKCDPISDNFVTLKLWGSDYVKNSSGQIYLYQIDNGEMYQVGFRDIQVAEFAPLAWGWVYAMPAPNRFYYTTMPLPLSMTQGRTSVTLRVVGAQVNNLGSPGVYRMYVHQGNYFEPAPGDPQAPPAPPAPIRPPGPTSVPEAVARDKAANDAYVNNALANGGGDPWLMLTAYKDPTSPGYQNAAAMKQVADGFTRHIDDKARGYFQYPSSAGADWGGIFGYEGDMVKETGAAGFGSRLDEVINLGDPAGPAPRRILWAKMLKASRDAGRFYRQGPTSAQSMIGDNNIYRANRGLQEMGSADAMPENQIIRYLLEAAGVEPWRGSDLPDGTSVLPMGTNYYEVSPAGLTKENGYVSAYGEVYDSVANFYRMSGDVRLRDQLIKMLKARSYMRYPMVDGDGYRSFVMVGPLDWRAHQTFPFDKAYGERGSRLSVAYATNDPMAVGFAKQMFEDNQGGTPASQQVLDWPDSGIRLPMTEGQPDFAWADVDNGLVAIKRGEELTWISTYWQARGGVHSMGRAMQVTPTSAHVSHIRVNTQINWNGKWTSRNDNNQWGWAPFQSHLGVVHQAYLNEKYMDSKNPSWGPGEVRKEELAGRAAFYSTRYGRYLVGINMDTTKSYVLKTPPGFTSAQDLITKTTKSGTITVAPFSAVVLDMGTNVETASLPNALRFISAESIPNAIAVNWDTAGGALTHTLQRATTPGGPFTTIASGLGATYPKKWGDWPGVTYIDTTAAAGTTYYYRAYGTNPNGDGYPSAETLGATRGAASVSTLPAPWANVNFTATTGSAAFNAGTFTLTGNSAGELGGPSDNIHFVYRPLGGNGTITVRLTALNGAANAGIMVRKTLAANAPFAGITYYPNGSVRPQKRDIYSENLEGMFGGVDGRPMPVWLRLERSGLRYTSWWAPDVNGAPGAWTVAGSFEIDDGMNGVTYLGMFASKGTPTFDNVTATGFGVAVPAAPTGLTAVPGSARVNLAWNLVSQAASYIVRRSTTIGGPYNTIVASNVTSLSYTDTTTVNGTAYYYVIAATNAMGTSPNSAQANATPRATAPAPTNLMVNASGTQAVLNWTASTGATSYNILRSLDGTNWTTIVTGVAGTTYTNTGLAAGQTYFYSLQAVNANGASPNATSATATSIPPAPLLRTTESYGSLANLRWDAAGGAASYKIWRSATANGTYTVIASGVATGSYSDNNLTRGNDYFYKVSALNGAGESGQSNWMKVGWGIGLLGSYFNSTDFSDQPALTRLDPLLTFDWGSNPPSPGMNFDFSVRWTGQLEAPTTETYTFTGQADDFVQAFINGAQVVNNGTINLVAGQKYDFVVEFRDGGGAAYTNLFWESPSIAQQNLPISRIYPSVAGKLRSIGGTATASSGGGNEGPDRAFDGNRGSKWLTANLGSTAWLQYQFANGTTWPINRYEITSANDAPGRDPKDWQLRGSNNGTSWTTLDTRSGETFSNRIVTKSYSFNNTTAYAYYQLNITGNLGGPNDGIQLGEVSLYSPSPLPPAPASITAVPGSQQATVSWSAVPAATSYLVKRSIYDGGPYTPIARVTSGTSLVDTKLLNGTRYYYVVSTTTAEGEGTNSLQTSALLMLASPTGLSATAGNGQVSLQWNAAPGATSYTVKRSTAAGGTYTNVATGVSGTSYTNTGLTNGITYYYVVSATNGTNTSANSGSASATPTAVGTATTNGTGAENEGAAQAFDGSSGSKWCVGQSAAWLQYQFGAGQIISGYLVTSANDVPERDPRDWTFEGSNDGTTWVSLDTRTAQVFAGRYQTNVYAAANATAYTRYRLNVTANAGGPSFALQLAELSFQTALPSPWSSGDIGAVGKLGGAAAFDGTFSISGSGSDIWGTADSFRYVYQPASGDCSITARVTGMQNTGTWAKAGVMIRETLNPNAVNVTCDITPVGNNESISRVSTGANASHVFNGTYNAPYWVRIGRTGDTFTSSRSVDGITWDINRTETVTMGTNVYIGMPVCSWANGTLMQTGFDNITAVP